MCAETIVVLFKKNVDIRQDQYTNHLVCCGVSLALYFLKSFNPIRRIN